MTDADPSEGGPELHGGCLCGAVRFSIGAPPSQAGYCHCTRCQRRTGTAASVQAAVDGSTFRLRSGEESLRGWRHPDGGFEKFFCAQCGAHLFSRNPEAPDQMAIRMSAFDVDPGIRPSYRQFVDYAAAWEPIPDDGIRRYGEGRPRPDPAS